MYILIIILFFYQTTKLCHTCTEGANSNREKEHKVKRMICNYYLIYFYETEPKNERVLQTLLTGFL